MSLFVISGCDAAKCIINNHPEFSKNNISSAPLNQVYEDSIKVSISNSLEDRDYRFTFKLDGELPDGITHETSGRTITFAGTPTELGDFPLTLSVVAAKRPLNPNESAADEPEDLCSDSESQNMVFSVVQGF